MKPGHPSCRLQRQRVRARLLPLRHDNHPHRSAAGDRGALGKPSARQSSPTGPRLCLPPPEGDRSEQTVHERTARAASPPQCFQPASRSAARPSSRRERRSECRLSSHRGPKALADESSREKVALSHAGAPRNPVVNRRPVRSEHETDPSFAPNRSTRLDSRPRQPKQPLTASSPTTHRSESSTKKQHRFAGAGPKARPRSTRQFVQRAVSYLLNRLRTDGTSWLSRHARRQTPHTPPFADRSRCPGQSNGIRPVHGSIADGARQQTGCPTRGPALPSRWKGRNQRPPTARI